MAQWAQAKVGSKRGALPIDAEFSGLDRPTSLGHEYLTYVLWAISPEGRPVNIGEVLVGDNHRSKLYVTTDRSAVVCDDRDSEALLCGASSQQPGGARKCCAPGYQGAPPNR
jgi:hypothetical protein